jgi:hypothetical protein
MQIGITQADMVDMSLRYPPSVLGARQRAADEGSFRERVRFDLVERPQHAMGLLAAADIARFAGIDRIVAIEFGVAEGAGLRNLADVAADVVEETGVHVDVVGFDSGQGLPAPVDFRDHPEIWSEGDFRTPDIAELRNDLPAGTELVVGPVGETVPAFIGSLAGRVVGFVSFDLDLYTSTTDALLLFEAPPEQLLPVVVSHFDDVLGGARRIGSLFRTEAAGQLLAIGEFNRANRPRHLDPIRILRHRRPLDRELWLERMYALHVLDHPVRSGNRTRPALSMTDHALAPDFDWPE